MFLHRRIRLNNRIQNPTAGALFRALTDEAENARVSKEQPLPYGEIAVKGLLLAFLSHLFREETAPAAYGAQWDGRIHFYDAIAPAVRMIHERYGEKITGEDLAAACNMSRAHFCRTFKAAIGAAPLQYLTEYRLRIADSVLRQSGARVSEAARIAGFSDEAYFSRCYKKSRGTAPSAKKAQLSKE
jgi:transcriptional regulator GlxA family with amidase domain